MDEAAIEESRALIARSPTLARYLDKASGTWVFQPHDYAVVIAHYDEDLEWVSSVGKAKSEVIVYHKGGREDLGGQTGYLVVNLPNVGRESHTYLTFILQHYDCLPKLVHFTQAQREDHASQLTCDFADLEQPFSPNAKLEYFKEGFTDDYRLRSYKGCDLAQAPMDGKAWFATYVNDRIDLDREKIYIWYAAIFSVSRERIRSRSKSYYTSLLKQLETHDNPEVGHFVERSWYYIFCCDELAMAEDTPAAASMPA